jgi:signal transduction histidine kinase
MLVAIRREDALIGVLSVGRRDAADRFSPIEERIGRQIAHLASLALANAELFQQLEGANHLKSQFVATMSHELRTPLHVILGYTELLLEGAFGQLSLAQIETLQRIGRSADSLCELVNATLDLSRLESGKIALNRQEVDIESLIAEVTRRTLDGAGRPSVELRCEVEPDLDPIETDPGKLKVVLGNLLANAFKFTEAGRVTLRVRRLDEGLELTVTDTGVGIPREAQEFIFEPFRQGDASMSRRYGGVGLGLHIVRQLLGVLGGVITLESEPARGSTFRVWLPTRMSCALPRREPRS